MTTSTPYLHQNTVSVQFNDEITPFGKRTASTEFEEEVNDDVERRKRRRSNHVRNSIANTPNRSSPINDSIKAMTESDLRSQLQIICKLNAENKINQKNVWSIRIIDLLRQMVKKENPDILTMAGNSLEVAAKVYGLRVDDIHAEALKLANAWARTFNNINQESDNVDIQYNDSDTEIPQAEKRKQKDKKRKVLSVDKKNIISEDPANFLAPLPRLPAASFSAKTDNSLSAIANLLTNKIRISPSGHKFLLGSDDKAWQWVSGTDASVNEEKDKKFPIKINPLKYSKLCSQLNDFQLNAWNETSEYDDLRTCLEEVTTDNQGFPVVELDGPVNDVFEQLESQDNDDEGDVIETNTVAQYVQNEIEEIVSFAPTERTNLEEMSSYSYNTVLHTQAGVIDRIWAGPSHWKFKAIKSRNPVYTGQEQVKQVSRKRTKRQDELDPLDFSQLKTAPPVQNTKKLANRKMLKFDQDLLPQLKPTIVKAMDCLKRATTMPSVSLNMKAKSEIKDKDSINDYNYNNPNDSNYCPDLPDNDDCEQNEEIREDSPHDFHGPEGLMSDNLVDMPEMVLEEHLAHFLPKAKRIDMKKLRSALWCVLTQKQEYDATAVPVLPTRFRQIYEQLPANLPDDQVKQLSVHVTFAALLHLCNEHLLKLYQHKDLNEIRIESG
ncbi:hypothetical protein ABEB36_002920 [Hypothenemus hampei]|uniref:Condensin complex subunit 2 n=1 Tax=Hypothenemus hampei TaxID=57062 RepID=A0ABD1F7E8_HYPHA